MSDYTDQIKKEAQALHEAVREDFASDTGEHGGASAAPNLMLWLDESGRLTARVEEIAKGWGHKDLIWVESNTRSKSKHAGGDKRSNAFASYLQDVRHAVKKIAKNP